MSWIGFAAVFTVFFLSHSIPVQPAIKARISVMTGPRAFGVMYSALSVAMLALLIWSAGKAPLVQLWPQLPWQRPVTHLGMLAVCLILALSVGRPNPFSFAGARNDQYDPTCPGITRWTRHPILLGLALWAGVHLLPNGDLAHVVLFGVLGAFAMAGHSLIDRRKRYILGEAHWDILDATRRTAPLVQAPISWRGLIVRVAFGSGVFVLLLWLHPKVIGVSAL